MALHKSGVWQTPLRGAMLVGLVPRTSLCPWKWGGKRDLLEWGCVLQKGWLGWDGERTMWLRASYLLDFLRGMSRLSLSMLIRCSRSKGELITWGKRLGEGCKQAASTPGWVAQAWRLLITSAEVRGDKQMAVLLPTCLSQSSLLCGVSCCPSLCLGVVESLAPGGL